MTVKAEVVGDVSKHGYPKIKKGHSGVVVLFNKPSCGTIIAGEEYHNIGEYHTNFDESYFSLFTGSVTLSNT